MERNRITVGATFVVAGALVLGACSTATETREPSRSVSTTRPARTTTTRPMTSTTTTTKPAPTTTTDRVTTTAPGTTTTTPAETTTTAAVEASTDCPDCPEWATDDDLAYVASMRLMESWYDRNFVTSMSTLLIIDMGQTMCYGLDGSYNGSLDSALRAMKLLYNFKPAEAAVAVVAIEQAVRVYCPKYTDEWIEWAGLTPYDPFE